MPALTTNVNPIIPPTTKPPVTPATPIPVPAYGSDIKDASGKVLGQAKFDPNTGLPLQAPTATTNNNTTQSSTNGSTTAPGANNNAPNSTSTGPGQTDLDQANADLKAKTDEIAAEGQRVSQKILDIQNGATPLSAAEQAQITGLQQQFQQLIDQQTLANTGASGIANTRGYQTGAAEYDPSFQVKTIGSIVSAGVAKISDLQVKEASAVAQLTQALKDNDINAIKSAYDIANTARENSQNALKDTVTKIQDQIKQANDAKIAAEKVVTDAAKDARDFAYKKEQDQKQADEKASEFAKNYNLDVKKNSLETSKFNHTLEMDAATGVSSLDDAGLTMLAKGYLTSGTLPSLGYGKSAVTMRTAVINKAVALSGGNTNVNPAVNKAMYDANKATLQQQQKNYTVADTAYRIFDKNGDLTLSLAQGLNKTNSPIANQLTNNVINQTTGKGQLDSFRAVLTSLQSEYATLINVKGGGGGQVTEGDKAKAEAAIPMNVSPQRLQEILTNLKTEGSNVLSERQQTLDQLQQNMTGSATAFNDQVANNPVVGQINTAKSAGYSSQEIVQNLTNNPQYKDSVSKAKSAGYSDDEIIDYLEKQK